jgi:hypothetical protein
VVSAPNPFQQWREADEAARLEERRLFHAALASVSAGAAPTDAEWISCGQLRIVADKLFELATKLEAVHPVRAVVREHAVRGVSVKVEVRAVGVLGWTWSYAPSLGVPQSNGGPLLPTDDDAFASAFGEAQRDTSIRGQQDQWPHTARPQ